MAMYDNAAVYDQIYSFKDYAAEVQNLVQLIQKLSPNAQTLLDLACGTGKHLEHLKTHYRSAGLDLSAELLAAAKKRNPELEFYQANMGSFDLGQGFDAITCLFSAIGYLNNPDELNQAVACMALHLNPGGVLLVEPWIFPEHFEAGHLGLQTVDQPDFKLVRMNSTRREGEVSFLEFNYLLGQHGSVRHWLEEHRLYLFSQSEYQSAFEGAGLRVEFDPQGIAGRGLLMGVKSASTTQSAA